MPPSSSSFTPDERNSISTKYYDAMDLLHRLDQLIHDGEEIQKGMKGTMNEITKLENLAALCGLQKHEYELTGLTPSEVLNFVLLKHQLMVVECEDGKTIMHKKSIPQNKTHHQKLAKILQHKMARVWIMKNPSLKGIVTTGFCESLISDAYDKGQYQEISLPAVNERIECITSIIDHDGYGRRSIRNKKDLGELWKKNLPPIPPQNAEQEWVSIRSKRNYAIDVAAGVVIPSIYRKYDDVSRLPPELQFLPKFQKPVAQMLEILGDDGVFGSFLHGPCFSLPFLAWTYLEGIDSLSFMNDPNRNKTRLIRVSSSSKSQDPVYAVFGKIATRLVRAVPCNPWELAILQCMNYEEEERFRFVYKYLKRYRGPEYAKEHTPMKKVFDILVLAISGGNGGFSWHSDLKPMLHSNDTANLTRNSSLRRHHLRVATAFFQNTGDGNCQLCYKPNDSKDERETTFELCPAGVHWQGNGNQIYWKHLARQSANGKAFYRLTLSCRESPQLLQKEGLDYLLHEYGKIPVYGWNGYKDYCIAINFKDSVKKAVTTTGISSMPGLILPESLENAKHQPCPYFIRQDDEGQVSSDLQCLRQLLPQIKSNIEYKRRSGTHPEYPATGKPSLAMVPEDVAKKIISGPFLQSLEGQGYRVGIQHGSQIFWAGTYESSPIALGCKLKRTEIKSLCGLEVNDRQIEPFASDTKLLHTLHLSKCMRAQLLSDDLQERRGPIEELHRITNGMDRLGFLIFLRGGSMLASGSSAAVVNSKIIQMPGYAGVSHLMPATQDLSTKHNRALIAACMDDRIVKVFVTDKQLPENQRLYENHKEPASVFIGYYRLESLNTHPPMELEEMNQYLEAVKSMYTKEEVSRNELNLRNLSFRARKCISVFARPLDKSPNPHTKELLIDADDPRRICIPVPIGSCPDELCLHPERDIAGLYDSNDGKSGCFLVKRQSRSLCQNKMISIISTLLVASACRICRLNVDSKNEVGPLVDSYPQTSGFEIPSFAHLVGKKASSNKAFLSLLGSVVQNNPMPCPLRDCDPKVALLLEQFSPGTRHTRGKRWIKDDRDTALTVLRSCIMAEMIGNATMLCYWNKHWVEREGSQDDSGRTIFFPSDKDQLNSLKNLILCSSSKHEVNMFLHGQYDQDTVFSNGKALCCALDTVWIVAEELLEKAYNLSYDCAVTTIRSLFKAHASADISAHQAASMVANANLVFNDSPFGRPVKAYYGSGAANGAKLVDWVPLNEYLRMENINVQRTSSSKEEILLLWFKNRIGKHNDFRQWFCVEDGSTNVIVRHTQREVNVMDMEHILCKFYIFMEYEDGGARAFTTNPTYRRRSCHPIPSPVSFPSLETFSATIVKEFVEFVDGVGVHVRRSDPDILGSMGDRMISLAKLALDKGSLQNIYSDVSRSVEGQLSAHVHDVGFLVSKARVRDICREKGICYENCGVTVLAERNPCEKVEDCEDIVEPLILDRFGPAATIHRSCAQTTLAPTVFSWHRDKREISSTVTFVPLVGFFFLLMESRPSQGLFRQDGDGQLFEQWVGELDEKTAEKCRQYYNDCVARSKKMGTSIDIFRCCRGDVITLPASTTYHSTIIPGNQDRLLYISHGLGVRPFDSSVGTSNIRHNKRRRLGKDRDAMDILGRLTED